ncbi:DUF3761 domain-containing protein [Amycolatopsis carbonis]|uniref:DUF3761 domain-containing protein n=1 Tax=Amycolatopsis carbonis TaxID=715471 RepID=A0A9Y2N0N2_9PSEU|nr:DUF3761 domain-containing protein [Amycolatopsis sp. 2-15]WIX82137.1 DUF3761 domain-containing protein [Amycolatopsis sp. 2-15]
MLRKLGMVLAAGLLVAGCGAAPAPTGHTGVVAPVTTISAPSSSALPESTSATPTMTDSPVSTTSVPAYVAPETTAAKATAPKTTAKAKTTPKTTAAPPKTNSAACSADYYRNSSGVCVHNPSSNPTGATAICNDGQYSYSKHRSGTCSGHKGVRTWISRPAT